MNKLDENYLDIEIDLLTNSIPNTISGDSFETEVLEVKKLDRNIISKSKGWKFDWFAELKQNKRTVYKLNIIRNAFIIQGL